MIAGFDQFVKNAAASPYIVFWGFVFTCLPIIYFLVPKIWKFSKFIWDSLNTSFKKQIQINHIRTALNLRTFKTREEFDHYNLNLFVRISIAVGILPVYFFSSLFLLLSIYALNGELYGEMKSVALKFCLMATCLGFSLIALVLLRVKRAHAFRRLFLRFAERTKLPRRADD